MTRSIILLEDSGNDKTIVMTCADKSSALVVFDRKEHVKEAEKQLGDIEIYERISNGTKPLLTTINITLERNRRRVELRKQTIHYFTVKFIKDCTM